MNIMNKKNTLFTFIFLMIFLWGTQGKKLLSGQNYPIGMNLDFPASWTTQIVFVDVFKLSIPFVAVDVANNYQWAPGVPVPSDVNGYPLEIPFQYNGRSYQAATILFKDLDGNYPGGTYTISIEGQGKVTVSEDAPEKTFTGPGLFSFTVNPGSEGIYIELIFSNPQDPVDKIEMILPGYENSAQTNPYHPFYPPFIEKLHGFKTIRVMNALQINGHLCDNPAHTPGNKECSMTWAHRVTPGFQSQVAEGRGMAWEYVVDFINMVDGADLWLNIPHAVDDDYIRQLARMMKQDLDEDRQVYIEWSNEVWNPTSSFPQHNWFVENAAESGLDADQFYVKGLLHIFDLFEEEFGTEKGRLVRVLSSQQGDRIRTDILLTHLQDLSINPNKSEIDVLAISAYIGISRIDPEDDLPTAKELLDKAEADIPVMITRSLLENKAAADAYGASIGRNIPVVAYEGGQHITPMDQDWEYLQGDEVMAPYIEANRHPRIYDIYQKWADAWFSNGGGLVVAFSYVTYPPTTGVFGHLERFDQPLSEAHKFRALQDLLGTTPSSIILGRTDLYFGYEKGGTIPVYQSFNITGSGGQLNWTVSTADSWLELTPLSGTANGAVEVSLVPAGLEAGTYTGEITVSDPKAANSPQTIDVTLDLYAPGMSSPPFGSFDTPVHNSTVRSSIPVSGWALDDTGVESVKIYRGETENLVYIGDAVFIEGARPDIEQAFPGYPMNYKAGWGYMMLTNFLPDNTYKIHAVALDIEGSQVTLGTKTIICDNANAVKPFGAIDTPTQGGTAFGSNFFNWGWVLTPQPNSIPTDGSTIDVYVNGINLGHPTYNIYRSDIANLFPGCANSDGAAGYFYLDTAAYENGVHSMHWTASDNAGNEDGIGSRYFTIQNIGNSQSKVQTTISGKVLTDRKLFHLSQISDIPINDLGSIRIKRGLRENNEPELVISDEAGVFIIKTGELERLVIEFSKKSAVIAGYTIVGNQLRSLPIGSNIDTKKGKFYWHPGPGFVGYYRFVFIDRSEDNQIKKTNIIVRIEPKFVKPGKK